MLSGALHAQTPQISTPKAVALAPAPIRILRQPPALVTAPTTLTNRLVTPAETAALIACLDLVITVDTSVAHLAGALGCPVWILLPYTPDYRWLLDRDDSPWYPTARLFRQAATRDYGPVIERIKSELQSLIVRRQPMSQASANCACA